MFDDGKSNAKNDRAAILERARADRARRELERTQTTHVLLLQRVLRGRTVALRARRALLADWDSKMAQLGMVRTVMKGKGVAFVPPAPVLEKLLSQFLFCCGRATEAAAAAAAAEAEEHRLQLMCEAMELGVRCPDAARNLALHLGAENGLGGGPRGAKGAKGAKGVNVRVQRKVQYKVSFTAAQLGLRLEEATDGSGRAVVSRLTAGGEAQALGVRVGHEVVGVDTRRCDEQAGGYDKILSLISAAGRPLKLRFQRPADEHDLSQGAAEPPLRRLLRLCLRNRRGGGNALLQRSSPGSPPAASACVALLLGLLGGSIDGSTAEQPVAALRELHTRSSRVLQELGLLRAAREALLHGPMPPGTQGGGAASGAITSSSGGVHHLGSDAGCTEAERAAMGAVVALALRPAQLVLSSDSAGILGHAVPSALFVSCILSVPLLTLRVSEHVLQHVVQPTAPGAAAAGGSTAATAAAPQQGQWARLLAAFTNLEVELPPSPSAVMDSSCCLLGNLLWLGHFMPGALAGDAATSLVSVWADLLEHVPASTYCEGATVVWERSGGAKGSGVQKAAVMPAPLVAQLHVALHDRHIRTLSKRLLPAEACFPRRRPTALPDAQRQAVRVETRPEPGMFAKLWQGSKWAKKLFGGGQSASSRAASAEVAAAARAAALHAKAAVSPYDSDDGGAGGTRDGGGAGGTAGPPPPVDARALFALCRFYGTFLQRWQGKSPLATGLLNVIAFSTPAVARLWSFLTHEADVERFAAGAAVACSACFGIFGVIGLFAAAFAQLLNVLDEDEMYERQTPLCVAELQQVVRVLKRLLFTATWVEAASGAGVMSQRGSFGAFLASRATSVLRQLHARDSRRPFCDAAAETWLVPELKGVDFVREMKGSGKERVRTLLRAMPFAVSFTKRAQLFEGELAAQRSEAQPEHCRPTAAVRVRRGFVLEDSFRGMRSLGRAEMRGKIHVNFVNAAGAEEMGIDAGGLFKELWVDLARMAFDPDYGLFKLTNDETGLYPNSMSRALHGEGTDLQLFEFVGKVLGKALFEGIVVEPKFAFFFLSKLLGHHSSLNDLASLDAELFKNLMFLKTTPPDMVEHLCLTMAVTESEFGTTREVPLCPGGAAIDVTAHNRLRYIHAVANYHLNARVREQCKAFVAGLYAVVDKELFAMFNEPELQVLISGTQKPLDVEDLAQHTRFTGGYTSRSKSVARLWKALEQMSVEEQSCFLRFVTSCPRPPLLGFRALQPMFTVHMVPVRSDAERLPSASTCFNTLKLPTYSSSRVLKEKLLLSVTSGAGFEMS